MLEKWIQLTAPMQVGDIGAAGINEVPPYQALIDRGLAFLNAFEADQRHHARLKEIHGSKIALFSEIVGDGREATLHMASAASGMSSLLAPSAEHLAFFNGFLSFGEIYETLKVATSRLDEVPRLPRLDFLKMDIQGSELAVLEFGGDRLKDCVAIQLEVSFVPLYRGQPCIGDIDRWMRDNGFLPHTFTDLKRWSVSPVIRNGNFRIPFNQLLEADIVYFRDLTDNAKLSDEQLKKLALIAHYGYESPDIVAHIIWLLIGRNCLPPQTLAEYVQSFEVNGTNPLSFYKCV